VYRKNENNNSLKEFEDSGGMPEEVAFTLKLY
jgi:hypothetical protein